MIGRTLSHYRITGKLGAGGMGIVYAAEDARLGRQVALKFVSSDLAHDDQAVQRLRSEAKAASALNHPNICTIHDIGEDDGHPFIVMELMKGQTLRERLQDGPPKVLQLVDIGIEVADALQVAHHEGIIHRDIKPGNIFLTERGHVKILDFGLAKLTQALTTATTMDKSPHPTATGITHGTPAYMSPEQATGEPLDGRTDVFSLGVVLYECATGEHPFPGKTPAVILAGILDRAPIPPLVHNPDLPPRLAEIISNCLEKDRELRYQSAADLRADLKRLRRDLDSASMRSMERAVSGTPASAADASRPDAPTLPISRDGTPRVDLPAPNRRAAFAAVAGVLAVIAVIAWLVAQPRQPAAPGAPNPNANVSESPVPPPATAPAVSPISTERQLALATASLNAGNYRAALTSAREVLALDPANSAAAKVRDQAAAMLARFDSELADARRRLAAGDLEGAARTLERARSIDAASPLLAELSARLSDAFRSRDTTARSQPGNSVSEPRRDAVPPPPAPTSPAAAPPSVPPVPVEAAPAAPIPPPNPAPSAAARPAEPAPRVEPPPLANDPPPPAADNDDSAIRQVIASYGRAIEGKDLRLFRTIKPNLTAEEERRLDEGFRAVTSQRVSLTVISLDRKGDRATAVIRRRDEIEAGGRRQTTDTRQALTLVKGSGGWVISEIR